MEESLTGQNVIITGASRGLGAEIARSLRRQGANILLVARDGEKLEVVRRELENDSSCGADVHWIAVDLAADNAVDSVIEHGHKIWNSLFGLVNNAGMLGPIGKAWETDWKDWKQTIRVNLEVPIALSRLCVPWMAEGRTGKIINLSGGGATGTRPNFSAYAVSKTGIVRFTENLALEVKDLNIQVNCIAPGALNTDMLKRVLEAGPEQSGLEEYEAALHQADAGGADPRLAAELCVFLMSSRADRITGKLISAVWDPWSQLDDYADDLAASDIYTLRRIVPADRDRNWGNS
ncbi:MAG: SDR family oxidoreductase [Desulfomonile sp.]